MYIRELQNKVNRFKRRVDPEVMEIEKRRERKRGIVKGIAIGGVFAGIATLFLSPDSGKNNRKKAKKELEKTRELLGENLVEGKNKIVDIYQGTKEAVYNKKNKSIKGFNSSDNINNIEEEFEEIYDDY